MERIKASTNKISPDGVSHPNQKYNNNKHNMVLFYNKWKIYNEILLTKKQTILQQSKNDKLSTLPVHILKNDAQCLPKQ